MSERWQACPVCQGRGTVPHNFYADKPATIGISEECRACDGDAVISTHNGLPPNRQPDCPVSEGAAAADMQREGA